MKTLRLTLLIFPFLFISQWSLAQKKKVKFGKIDLADVQMTEYPEDPDADAVILYDKGVSKIEYITSGNKGFVLYFERHQRIKVLKETGKKWGDFVIGVYQSQGLEEKLKGLKAITYNVDGKTISEEKLSNSEVFKEKKSVNWTLHKFALPNVKVGSVIDVKYQIESEFFFNFQEWDFQHTIPCVWSEYKIEIPEYFIYNKNMRGYELERLTVNEATSRNNKILFSNTSRSTTRAGVVSSSTDNSSISLRVNQNHWVTENMPAFREEAYMLNVDDYLTGVEFELALIRYPNQAVKEYTTNWREVGETLNKHPEFGQLFNRKGWIKDQVAQISASTASAEGKIGAAYHLIQSQMQWDGRNQVFASSTLKKAFEGGKGSSADINLLLVLLLQALELEAAPVLVSTRKHGRINPVHPSINQFNYVVAGVKINESILLLDATSKELPPGMLPIRGLNDRGRWIGPQHNDWVNLQSNASYDEVSQLQLALGEGRQLAGSIKRALKKYSAYQFRTSLAEAEDEASYFTDWAEGYEGFQIEEHAVKNANDLSKDIRMEWQVTFEDRVEEANDLLFFTPLLIFAKDESPFKQKERLYPVDLPYTINEKYILKFEIPTGYALEETPEDLVMSLPDGAGKFSYTVKQINEIVLVNSSFKLNKLQFLPADYGALKTFYDLMVEKQAELVVFKKK